MEVPTSRLVECICGRDVRPPVAKPTSVFGLKQATVTSRFFIALGLALLAGIRGEADASRPNSRFILTEDQEAQMGVVGTPGLQTPHMDSLAGSVVFFNNAFVVYPVCSPPKAASYTGLHNHANGILNKTPNYHKPANQIIEAERNNALYRRNRIRAEIPTLADQQ